LCASPDYLKEHGEPQTPRELARHQCLVHINSDPSDRVWRLRCGNGQMSIKVQGPLLFLVFSPGKPTPQKIRLLGDFLVAWFRKRPIPH